jgi:benzoyl-CoA reductase/2-hydroxyglutaryl-CoA dehydratase subunit BcrC/BadD/HgdB
MNQYTSYRKKQGEEIVVQTEIVQKLNDSLLYQKQVKDTLILVEKEQKQKVEVDKKNQEQLALFDRFIHVNPTHFKLDKHVLVNDLKGQKLDIMYPSYLQKEAEVFPENILINVTENNKFTNIDIDVKSVVFDTKLSIPFTIPSGYKKLDF